MDKLNYSGQFNLFDSLNIEENKAEMANELSFNQPIDITQQFSCENLNDKLVLNMAALATNYNATISSNQSPSFNNHAGLKNNKKFKFTSIIIYINNETCFLIILI